MGAAPPVSLIVVNRRTPLQTRLCLRSLRRYTPPGLAEVIAVDNASDDASLEYLRGLVWIRLIENRTGPPTHQHALDLGVAAARGRVIGVLHSDTFVRREGWLQALLQHMDEGVWIVGSPERLILPVGPWSWPRLCYKRWRLRRRWRRLGRPPKLITHCALYRRELFEEHGQRFDHPEWHRGMRQDCGEPIQRYCEAQGLGIRVLGREQLAPLLWHFEGATLNAVNRRRLGLKRRLRAWRFYRRPEIRALLADRTLDV
ncbi:MAG: hypothetical protein KatS3mg102_0375 [Planctomycetota bacterium]|nr:MAG: hypothetical protein KatS3mg102_0375 [Planctomycetota bacterium]